MTKEMIDSGIEWVGKIPKNWKVVPNKRVMSKIKKICDIYNNEDILSLSMNGVLKRNMENPMGKMPESFDGYQYVYKDNLIMCLFDMDVTPRCIGLSNFDGLISPAYTQFKLLNKKYNKYYYYYYLYLDNTKELLHLSKNLRSSITDSQLGEIHVPVPDEEEAVKIANYLDDKCSLIDEIISGYEKGLKLLEEFKQSIISSAIEKGLENKIKNINNKFVKSIPSNSKFVTLKQVSRLITDGTHQTPNYLSEGIPFLSIKDISSGNIDLSDCKYISHDEHLLLSKHANIESKDLLFCRIGTLGRPVVVEDKNLPFDIFVSLGLIKVKRNVISPYYLRYVMLSNYYTNYIDIVKVDGGVSAAKFNLSSVKNSPIILPDLKEQERIIKYLDEKCSKLDKVIEYRKHIIEKLEEYKKSLIYEVVTGKKEV